MSDVIWKWRKGNINIFTRKKEIAEEAMQKGEYVIPIRHRSHIFFNSH